MATTVWLDEDSRDRLVALKAHYNVSSIGAVIRKLLDGPQDDARQIFVRCRDQVVATCREHRISRVVAFGSRARGDADPDSDLDLAIEMEAGCTFQDFLRAKRALEQAVDCPTDVIEMPSHRPRMLANIERDAVVLLAR